MTPFKNKENVLNKLGVPIYDNNGKFRKTYDVLNDLANVWKNLSPSEEEYFSNMLFKLF